MPRKRYVPPQYIFKGDRAIQGELRANSGAVADGIHVRAKRRPSNMPSERDDQFAPRRHKHWPPKKRGQRKTDKRKGVPERGGDP